MIIVLCGFKGCGKTTIGKRLATDLGLTFSDVDEILENEYSQKNGAQKTAREIYTMLGEKRFRSLEKSVLLSALKNRQGVLALGGGSIVLLQQLLQEKLIAKQDIFLVYIKQDKELIYERIIRQGIPAFFDSKNPRQSFEKIYSEREPLYKSLADLKATGSIEDGIVQHIIRALPKQKVK